MYIKVYGRPAKVTPKECRAAAQFYAGLLMPKHLVNRLQINIIFKKSLKKQRLYGYCEWKNEDDQFEFDVAIDPSLSSRALLITLAHEMVHVKQYARKELRDSADGRHCRWLRKNYNVDKMDFRDYPWEIDAVGRELGLYQRFKAFSKKTK